MQQCSVFRCLCEAPARGSREAREASTHTETQKHIGSSFSSQMKKNVSLSSLVPAHLQRLGGIFQATPALLKISHAQGAGAGNSSRRLASIQAASRPASWQHLFFQPAKSTVRFLPLLSGFLIHGLPSVQSLLARNNPRAIELRANVPANPLEPTAPRKLLGLALAPAILLICFGLTSQGRSSTFLKLHLLVCSFTWIRSAVILRRLCKIEKLGRLFLIPLPFLKLLLVASTAMRKSKTDNQARARYFQTNHTFQNPRLVKAR